jgi:hypothetical protein
MKSKNTFLLIVSLTILLVGAVVQASLYAEKVPDPSRFVSIEPLWSGLFETQEGDEVKISLLEFVWLGDDGIEQPPAHMFYLSDGVNEYLSESTRFSYSEPILPDPNTDNFVCEPIELYKECVIGCDEDSSCIQDCFNEYCEEFLLAVIEEDCIRGPDNSCGIKTTDVVFFQGIESKLIFDPESGKIFSATLKGQNLNLKIQSGFLSSGRFRAQ